MKLTSIMYIEMSEKPFIAQMRTIILQYLHQFPENILIAVKLDLTRTVKNNVVIFLYNLVQLISEPGLILEKVLNTKEECTIGTEFHLFHGIFQSDKILDVSITCVLVVFGCRIEVEYDDVSSESLCHLLHVLTVG
jgi:hypothetical protein